jgi:3-methylcrotonyl-CoA carboxylase alpha subunit
VIQKNEKFQLKLRMKRILIANRGEIAVRIMKTIHRLGLESVLLFHEDERDMEYLNQAGILVSLGKGSVGDTFLNIPKIIDIAKKNNCDTIHPGYGFLSENYLFAKACEENGILFIGPSSSVIRQMSSKSESKKIAEKLGIPTLQSIEFTSYEELISRDLNYPLMIKAASGGGGKGMKIVRSAGELLPAILSAGREAIHYFGDKKLIAEPFLDEARHIEVQILGDNHGNLIHLFERECSIQRNHQKVIEEAPAVSVGSDLKNQLFQSALSLAGELNYTNAGTVEFLVNGDAFYFLEMNTRLQVEHGVTEMITGIDIVEEQIRIAGNQPISQKTLSATFHGHAIEARVCAENPYTNFTPSAGTISYKEFPGDIRIDTFIQNKTKITPSFDSLIAKTIVWAENRNEAIMKMNDATSQMTVIGVQNNLYLLKQIFNSNFYKLNQATTTTLEKKIKRFCEEYGMVHSAIDHHKLVVAFCLINFLIVSADARSLWHLYGVDPTLVYTVQVDENSFHCSMVKSPDENYRIYIDGNEYNAFVLRKESNYLKFTSNGIEIDCHYSVTENLSFDWYEMDGIQFRVSSPQILRMALNNTSKNLVQKNNHRNQIVSPLFGRIIDIKVKKMDRVKKGDLLVSIDSMKTENHILAPFEGIIEAIYVQPGNPVQENVELLKMNPIT